MELFYLKTLLNIEGPSVLMPKTIDGNFIDKLNSYALMLPLLKKQGMQVYNGYEYYLKEGRLVIANFSIYRTGKVKVRGQFHY